MSKRPEDLHQLESELKVAMGFNSVQVSVPFMRDLIGYVESLEVWEYNARRAFFLLLDGEITQSEFRQRVVELMPEYKPRVSR